MSSHDNIHLVIADRAHPRSWKAQTPLAAPLFSIPAQRVTKIEFVSPFGEKASRADRAQNREATTASDSAHPHPIPTDFLSHNYAHSKLPRPEGQNGVRRK